MSPSRSASPTPVDSPEQVLVPPRGARDWLWIALIANLLGNTLIILTGGLVRLTGSGLGCPTWPECTPGSIVPVAGQAEGFHKFIEFGNRMMSPVLVVIAVAVIVLAFRRYHGATGRPLWRDVLTMNTEHRRSFVRACTVPFIFVMVQAILGGVIVLAHLDPKTVSPHFVISIFLVANGVYLLWRYREGDGAVQPLVPQVVRTLAWVTTAVGLVVVVLGTAVTGSGPHSGDKDRPVRFGFDPHATSWLHADSVMLFCGLVVALVVAARLVPVPTLFARAWTWVLYLSVVQGVLGYVQYFTGRPIVLVAAHLLLAAVMTAVLSAGVLATRRR